MKKVYGHVRYLGLTGMSLAVILLVGACNSGMDTSLTNTTLKETTDTSTDNQSDNSARPLPPILSILDADQDGIISAAEIENAPTALSQLDTSGDGIITNDELCPAKPESSTDDDSVPPPPDPGPRHGMGPPSDPVMKALDTDQDGQLSAGEIANAATALKQLDTNGDGTLTQDELHPAKMDHPPMSPFFRVLDTDQNGEISAGEIDSAATVLAQLDSNVDGIVTRDELCQAKPEASSEDASAPSPPPMGPGPKPGMGRPEGAPPFEPILKILDTDQDGQLSAEEITNAPTVLKQLDTNGDGKLTSDELRPAKLD